MTLEDLKNYIRPLQSALMVSFLILSALSAGILEAASPGLGVRLSIGTGSMLRSIPTEFYALFGTLGLGYIAARTIDKRT